jgi:hypothetical protein
MFILGDQFLGLVGFPNRPIRIAQHRFLVNYLPIVLNIWPFIDAYTYGSCMAGQHLNKSSSEQRIRRACAVNCLHDLLTSILWGLLRTLVYSTPINELATLHQGTENTYQEIRKKQWIFARVSSSVWRRGESYVEMHGHYTEHVADRSQELRPYQSRHWFLGLFAHSSECCALFQSFQHHVACAIEVTHETGCWTRLAALQMNCK